MSDVNVQCQPAGDGWSCHVTVSDRSGQTEHEVSVGRAAVRRLAGDLDDPTRLVEVSFDYLLEHEPKESILRSFALSEIERYFPAYPQEINARL